MKQDNEKLTNNYTIHLDDATRDQVEKIAQYYQRKPSELLRLLLVPILINEYAKIQQQEHQENNEPMRAAKFNF